MTNWSCTQLDVVRHGQHVLGDKICGVTDPVLSEVGWKQLHDQCQRLADLGHGWDIVLTSPRKRCFEFAFEYSQLLGVDCIDHQGFAEVDFGDWETLTFQEVNERFPGQWQEWVRKPDERAPHGGENYADFLDRVRKAVDEVLHTYQGKRVLLIAHAGVMRAVYCRTLDLNPSSLSMFSVPYACHSRIKIYHHSEFADWYQLDVHNSSAR